MTVATSTTDTPCIIEVALSCRPDRNPTAPLSTADLIDQGLACIDAGASIVHMHIADLRVSAAEATRQYLECFRPWLARDPDVLTLPTNGWGDTIEVSVVKNEEGRFPAQFE